jgi:hypothetical protein
VKETTQHITTITTQDTHPEQVILGDMPGPKPNPYDPFRGGPTGRIVDPRFKDLLYGHGYAQKHPQRANGYAHAFDAFMMGGPLSPQSQVRWSPYTLGSFYQPPMCGTEPIGLLGGRPHYQGLLNRWG